MGCVAARLHSAKGQSYSWPLFWAERRLLPHCARNAPAVAQRVEALAADLPNRLPAPPSPALLHGGLWGGNVLAADNRVSALIDPACYYGHAEVDIAMLELFDTPSPSFYEAYGALEPRHRERPVIYRLWSALIHLQLFGDSHRPLVLRLLAEAGA